MCGVLYISCAVANLHILVMQHAMKRQAVGIWKCKACKKVQAGGAYTLKCAAFSKRITLPPAPMNKFATKYANALNRRDCASVPAAPAHPSLCGVPSGGCVSRLRCRLTVYSSTAVIATAHSHIPRGLAFVDNMAFVGNLPMCWRGALLDGSTMHLYTICQSIRTSPPLRSYFIFSTSCRARWYLARLRPSRMLVYA